MKKTVKSMIFMVMMLVTLFCLTGCANVNYEIRLERNGSGEISYTMGYDKTFMASMGVNTSALESDTTLKEMMTDAEKEGYSVEKYEDNDTYGFKASKKVNNVQEEFSLQNTIGEEKEESNDKIVYEKTLLKTKYSQDAKMDLAMAEGTSTQETAMMKAMIGQIKISYKVVLPFKAGENNATTVSEDGKTLEWKMEAGKVNEIKFAAQEDYTVMAMGGMGVIVILIIIVIMNRKGRKKQEEVVTAVIKEQTKVEEKTESVEDKKEEVKETPVVEPQEAVTEETIEEKITEEEQETPKQENNKEEAVEQTEEEKTDNKEE